MEEKINGELTALLAELPPDIGKLEKWLKETGLDPDEITLTAIKYIEECCEWEYEEKGLCSELLTPEKRKEFHSTYLCDELELLLKFGLKPNAVYDGGNCLAVALRFVV